jgi:type IV pilus assembly protein PilC
VSRKQPETDALARFFRSLSTMHSAGIPLHQGLDYLSEGGDGTSGIGELAHTMATDVMTGHTFSSALSRFPKCFDKFCLTMIRVGETTGRLDVVLVALANHLEWVWANKQKLKSTLTYPAFSLILCLGMAVVGPAYILRGQLEMLKSSNITLPAITKGLILFSDMFHSPVFLALATAFGILFFVLLKTEGQKPRRRDQVYRLLCHVPGLADLLRINALSRFCQAFGLLLRAGVGVSHAVPLACSSTGDPIMTAEGPRLVQYIVDGSSLADSLSQSVYADGLFSLSLEAGEQTGTVAKTMTWLGKLYATELESRFEKLTALLEPALMLFTGLCVGLLLVATLLPTVRMLEVI